MGDLPEQILIKMFQIDLEKYLAATLILGSIRWMLTWFKGKPSAENYARKRFFDNFFNN
jgi:hypothetical protein